MGQQVGCLRVTHTPIWQNSWQIVALLRLLYVRHHTHTGRPFFNAIYFVLVALPMWVNNEVGLRVASKKSRCGLQTMS